MAEWAVTLAYQLYGNGNLFWLGWVRPLTMAEWAVTLASPLHGMGTYSGLVEWDHWPWQSELWPWHVHCMMGWEPILAWFNKLLKSVHTKQCSFFSSSQTTYTYLMSIQSELSLKLNRRTECHMPHVTLNATNNTPSTSFSHYID